jgi:hypothetical protein
LRPASSFTAAQKMVLGQATEVTGRPPVGTISGLLHLPVYISAYPPIVACSNPTATQNLVDRQYTPRRALPGLSAWGFPQRGEVKATARPSLSTATQELAEPQETLLSPPPFKSML